jgi:GNAT superfamily N-acetyltransferase
MSTAHDATIRTARLDDYEQVCRLTDLLDVVHRDGAPWMFRAPDVPPRSDAYFAELLSRDDSAVFVADAGQIVGVAFGLLRAAPDLPIFHQQRWGVLDGLVVEPAWRRRGIGKLLTYAVEKWATDLGVPWVELNVYQFNVEARQFYEALGYLPYSTKLRKPSPGAA